MEESCHLLTTISEAAENTFAGCWSNFLRNTDAPFCRSSENSETLMKTHLLADPVRYLRMTTSELRETFLIGSLYQPGSIQLTYVDLDRAVVGIAAPQAR